MTAALWRRLDVPGHDACRLRPAAGGWVLDGTAVFRHAGAPAALAYRVECDAAWQTRRGRVRGWLGDRAVDQAVERAPDGAWTLDGVAAPGLDGLVDLDLGFTPATNLIQLRRVALAVGEAAEVPVAWLDAGADALLALAQRYERRTEATYWYESPGVPYAALLELAPSGFARRYPGLWELAE